MAEQTRSTAENTTGARRRGNSVLRRCVRYAFPLWAILVMLWLANSYRTRAIPDEMLRSSQTVSVVDGAAVLEFLPRLSAEGPALIFICGSGVAAQAYTCLVRPIAEAGYPVFVVKLPYRFAPLESHKQAAVDRVRDVMTAHPGISHWVVAGHSLGGALACRAAQSNPQDFAALVLVGTTHPKQDLSSLPMLVTKIYASNDKVAPPERMFANKRFLPADTKWVEIKGGNHSQFGHYGHQLFDGKGAISRQVQQTAARAAILNVLVEVE